MKLMMDTDLGILATPVYNYVEGGDTQIAVMLPEFSGHSPHCIGEMFEQTVEYLEGNLHELYSIIDGTKGKHLRRLISKQRLELEFSLAEACCVLPNDLEVAEYRDNLRGEMAILDDLLDLRKSDLRASLQLIMVEIIDDQSAFYAHFGVPGLSVAPVVVLVEIGV
jgi:hypothetical protein